jgi:DNA-binding transcriptional MocR family regulator
VLFVPGEHFFPDGVGGQFIRLCYSATTPDVIAEGVRRLGDAMGHLTNQAAITEAIEPLV